MGSCHFRKPHGFDLTCVTFPGPQWLQVSGRRVSKISPLCYMGLPECLGVGRNVADAGEHRLAAQTGPEPASQRAPGAGRPPDDQLPPR